MAARKLPVVASEGFLEEATSENVMVGTGMARRSIYQFGRDLPRTAKGQRGHRPGQGRGLRQHRHHGPNHLIEQPEQSSSSTAWTSCSTTSRGRVPGRNDFQHSRAQALRRCRESGQQMHNLLPVRGAKVRDALRWSNYMDQALVQTQGAEIYIGSHNWPVWGNAASASW